MVYERYKTDSIFYLSGNRIIPVSAHSAYDKAAQYFKIKLWRVPVDQEFKADVKAIRRHINRNTILVRLYSDTFRLFFFHAVWFCMIFGFDVSKGSCKTTMLWYYIFDILCLNKCAF